MSRTTPKHHVIIVGAMKCGTTTLFDYLAEHPAICPAFAKEPNFFCETIRKPVNVTTYEGLWPDYDEQRHRYVMEASTAYTKLNREVGVPQRMAGAGLQPRFIYVMRDPFDRIESQYNHQLNLRGEAPCESLVDDHLVELSDYYLQLDQYTSVFPRESLLLLDFDQLVSAPQDVLARVLDFLDLEASHSEGHAKTSNKTEMVSGGELWVRRNRWLMAVSRWTPAGIKSAIRSLMRKSTGNTSKRSMTAEERAAIHERLAPAMRKLHDEYGVDVAKWGFSVS